MALLICFGLSTVRAQVALKPSGEGVEPLREKALAARVTVRAGQFATTDLDMRFLNHRDRTIEADFLYTVPEGAVVTDFAYFNGDERVPARIAEKERAAAIYARLTNYSRDPALVEMVGKNTFRARISPVFPNADLRVQIRYVQALPVARDGSVTYRLPVALPGNERLDSVSVDVRYTDLEAGSTLQNSLGAPMVTGNGSVRLAFTDTNFHAPKELAVRMVSPKASAPGQIAARMIAAPSGGSDGFFALALSSAAKTLTDSRRFALVGVPVYDLETSRLGNGLLVCGRYRGAGRGRLLSSGSSCATASGEQALIFPGRAEANNPASKFWASARIARLSASEKNRDAVVGLSERFTLPSKWTSWIAIPADERIRIAREEAEANYNKAFGTWVTALGTEGDRKEFTLLDARLDRAIEKLPSEEQRERREEVMGWREGDLERRLGVEIASGKGASLKASALWARLNALHPNAPLTASDAGIQRAEYEARVDRLAALEAAGQGNSPEAVAHRNRTDRYLSELSKEEQEQLRANRALAIRKALAGRLADLTADKQGQSVAARAIQSRMAAMPQPPTKYRNYDWDEAAETAIVDKRFAMGSQVETALLAKSPNFEAAHRAWVRYQNLRTDVGYGYRTDPIGELRGVGPYSMDREDADSDRFGQILSLIARGKQNAPAAARLRQELSAIFAPKEVDALVRSQADDYLRHLSEQWVYGKHGAQIGWRADYRSFEEYGEPDWHLFSPQLSPEVLAETRTRMDTIARYANLNVEDAVQSTEEPWTRFRMFQDRAQVVAALQSGHETDITAAKSHFVAAARSGDEKGLAAQWKFYRDKNTPEGRAAFAQDRVDRLAARIEGERLDAQLAARPNAADIAAVHTRRDTLRAEEERLRVRMGDPLVIADAPADARSVVALMPDGTVLPLAYDAANARWQARFDVPTAAAEGTYTATVIVLLRDGTRQTQSFVYAVDMTAPKGTAHATRTGKGGLRLDVDADPDTARIDAAWSGGSETVALAPIASETRGRFFALLDPAQVASVGDGAITIALTDRAHNRTTLTVMVSAKGAGEK